MADGSIVKAIADQRDVARWECEPFGGPFLEYPMKVNTFFRYLAFRSMLRAGAFTGTWERFADECVEVHDLKPDDGGGEGEDPGEAAPSDMR